MNFIFDAVSRANLNSSARFVLSEEVKHKSITWLFSLILIMTACPVLQEMVSSLFSSPKASFENDSDKVS